MSDHLPQISPGRRGTGPLTKISGVGWFFVVRFLETGFVCPKVRRVVNDLKPEEERAYFSVCNALRKAKGNRLCYSARLIRNLVNLNIFAQFL